MREVGDENDRHRHHGNQWLGENLEGEIHRDKSNRDTRQGREQRSARGHPAHAFGDESGEDFNDAVEKTSDEPYFPRPDRIFGFLHDRQHDKKHVSKQAHGVDAVRKRGDILTPRFARQAARLPGIEKVAEQDRDRRAGKNPAEDILVRQMNQLAAKTDDKNELNQIIDHQTEKAVEIFAHEPGWIEGSLGHERNSPDKFPANVAVAGLTCQIAVMPRIQRSESIIYTP